MSITPQAARVFAALARSTPPSATQPSVSASPAPSTVSEQPSMGQALSGSVIVPSWPPVAEDHLLAVRGHVVEASTVRPASPLVTSEESDSTLARKPMNFSLNQQSTTVSTPSHTSKLQSITSSSTSQTSTSSASLLSAMSPTATGRVPARHPLLRPPHPQPHYPASHHKSWTRKAQRPSTSSNQPSGTQSKSVQSSLQPYVSPTKEQRRALTSSSSDPFPSPSPSSSSFYCAPSSRCCTLCRPRCCWPRVCRCCTRGCGISGRRQSRRRRWWWRETFRSWWRFVIS